MASPPKIKKLDEVVVNRIAAGEIIQKPANALKELIENSLDAKSTDIQITVKEGGLKLLQIQDNGTGIRKEDLDIVCERFTTSKLEKFEDLQGISTYGFRGEALSSISHVSQLTITTKTAQEKAAYKASYIDGKLKSIPKPIAGNQGTTITIENLFYNVATRKKALENANEQFSLIQDVVLKYAIHNSGVGFTLKKQGVNTPVLRTPFKATKMNNIQSLFGINLSRELMEVNLEDKDYKFKVEILLTNPFYHTKKWTFLLFINHRLVENSLIKKMLEEIYSIYLPKRTFPWVYMSLEIDPQNVDVNIHPTKSEVRFIHEHKIIDQIRIALDNKLTQSNSARTFYVQARLPEVDLPRQVLVQVLPEFEDKDKDKNSKDKDKNKKIYAKEMIRTDHKEQKLDKFNFTINSKSINQSDDTHNASVQNLDRDKIRNVVEENVIYIKEELCLERSNMDEECEMMIEKISDNVAETNVNDTGFTSINDNLQINSRNLITSTQAEEDLESYQKQTESPLIPDSVAELFTTDESSSDIPTDPVPMSKSAERALKSVIRTFGSQTDHEEISEIKHSFNNHENDRVNQSENSIINKTKNSETNQMNNSEADKETVPEFKSYSINNFRREVQITSVLKLRKVVEDSYHGGLRKLFSELKFIACVDSSFALIQSDINLYICNTKKLAEELFYEIMLYDFANYGVLKFSEPLPITELALLGLELEEAGWTEKEKPKKELAEQVKDLFLDKAPMLKEYFSIVVTKSGCIKSLPMLLENYYPSEVDLPLYILRMATEIDWSEEKACFDGVCRETARYFSHVNEHSDQYDWKHLTEFIIYATIKESLLPPKYFSQDSTILRIASLPDLYKHFERC